MNAYVVHGCLDALVCCISCRVPFVCVSMLHLHISHAFDRIHVIGRFHVFGQIHVCPCDTPHKFSASPYGQTWLEVHLRFVTKPTRHDFESVRPLAIPYYRTIPCQIPSGSSRLVPAIPCREFFLRQPLVERPWRAGCAWNLKMPHHQGESNRFRPLPDPGDPTRPPRRPAP